MSIRQTANIPGYNRDPLVDDAGRMTTTWVRFFQELWRRVGGGAAYSLGGTIHNDMTAVGNVGSGEDVLITYSLPKDTLYDAGDKIEIEAFGSLAANGNNKNIKLYFGSQVIFTTGAVASNAKDWHIRAVVVRKTETTQAVIAHFSGDTVLVTQTADYVAGTQDQSADITIKCTGEATNDNDIVQQGLVVNYCPVNG